MSYKYRFYLNGEWIYGNTIDALARSVSNSSSHTYEEAFKIVSASLVPVVAKTSEQNFYSNNTRKKLALRDVEAGALSAMKQIAGITVEQSEINRRAIICSACPLVTDISYCGSCGGASKIVTFINKVKTFFGGGVTIPNGLGKRYCDACSCSLAMMLPAPLDQFLDSTKKDTSRPDTCWLKSTN